MARSVKFVGNGIDFVLELVSWDLIKKIVVRLTSAIYNALIYICRRIELGSRKN